MIQIETASSAAMDGSPWQTVVAARDRGAHDLRVQAGHILRLMILVLVALLLVLVGLVVVTGRGDIGGPIIGGVLLIGFSAAQFGR